MSIKKIKNCLIHLRDGLQHSLYVVKTRRRCQTLEYYQYISDADQEDVKTDFLLLLDRKNRPASGLVKKYINLNCLELRSNSHRFFFKYYGKIEGLHKNPIIVFYGLEKTKKRISGDQEKTISQIIKNFEEYFLK